MNEQQHYFRDGKKGQLKERGWWSYWTKPYGKKQKRSASKKARTSDLPSGNSYKKVWGWFEWS